MVQKLSLRFSAFASPSSPSATRLIVKSQTVVAMALFNLTKGYLLFTTLHFLCFVFALAVCGLYGTDLQRANERNSYIDGKWVRLLRCS